MEIIEKQTIKEVPADGYYGDGRYSRRLNGKADAGLALGIVGTVLGAGALFGRGAGLFGLGGSSNGTPANININGLEGGYGTNGTIAPTSFEAWEKSCEDTLALQKGLYDWALVQQSQRFSDRETLNSQLFSVWKSQVDSDFGLYKSSRDTFDVVNQKMADNAFALYKNQRDGFDALAARIGALETKQAVADAVEPWRAKVLDMKINGVAAGANAGIALEAERRACADNKIVTYVNGTFYPIEVADITVGTTSTPRSTYNPLCSPCCNSYNTL